MQLRELHLTPRAAGRFAVRFLPLIILLLWPWPGVGRAFASGFGAVSEVLVSPFISPETVLHFQLRDSDIDHPWWLYLAVKNRLTGQSYGIPVDTRTLAYVRLAVFLALAVAWPVPWTRRGITCLASGAAALLAVIGVSLALPLMQVLELLGIVRLGVYVQSLASVGILSLVSYPSMAYAVPGLIYALAVWVSVPRARGARRLATA
jgi:hypothetical protein